MDKPHNNAAYIFHYCCFLRMATDDNRKMQEHFCSGMIFNSNLDAINWQQGCLCELSDIAENRVTSPNVVFCEKE